MPDKIADISRTWNLLYNRKKCPEYIRKSEKSQLGGENKINQYQDKLNGISQWGFLNNHHKKML